MSAVCQPFGDRIVWNYWLSFEAVLTNCWPYLTTHNTQVALKQALEREAGEEAWLIKTEGEKEELISTLEARVETLRNMDRLLYCDHALNLKGWQCFIS